MNTYKNITDSRLVVTGRGTLDGFYVNATSSGTLSFIDGTEGGAVATSDLTSSGACAPASHAVNVLTSTGAMTPSTHATSVFTVTANPTATETVTIGAIVYTFVAALSTNPGVAYEVLIGATATATLLNLKYAINKTVGDSLEGTLYGLGTVAHPDVVASASDATTVTVWGRVPGTSLNTKATTETCANASWPDTTLGGGAGASDAGVATAGAIVTIGTTIYTVVVELSETQGAAAVAYEVLYGGSVAVMLDNLKLAINGTGTAGTNYSTGTVAHTQVVATTNTDTAQTIRGLVPGTSLNTVVTTEGMANTSWADTTLGGGTGASDPGVTTSAATITINGRVYTVVLELSETLGASAIADQILWTTSEAIFLDNVKKAINASGLAGTDYSTGTTINVDVAATVNTNTVQTVNSKYVGTSQNAITTSTTLANYAWTSTVLAGGTGATGRVITGTITPAIGSHDLFKLEFTTGLFVTVGGTSINATLSLGV